MRIAILTAALALALPAAADPVAWTWEPGAGAESHDVILSRNGEAYRFAANVAEPRFELDVPPGESAVIMVQARHADGRAGPYSVPSEVGRVFPDPEPVGEPGQPVRVTIEGTLTVE